MFDLLHRLSLVCNRARELMPPSLHYAYSLACLVDKRECANEETAVPFLSLVCNEEDLISPFSPTFSELLSNNGRLSTSVPRERIVNQATAKIRLYLYKQTSTPKLFVSCDL